jgi:hypothetical protein
MTPDNTPDKTYLINDVSQRVGLSQKRLRDYEKGGLIRPAREPKTKNRLYTEKDIRRISRIKSLIHENGFTLASLRYMVANLPCWIIFDCEGRASCPGYASPKIACYEMARKSDDEKIRKDCEHCPVYLNRDFQKMPLLGKPPGEKGPTVR